MLALGLLLGQSGVALAQPAPPAPPAPPVPPAPDQPAPPPTGEQPPPPPEQPMPPPPPPTADLSPQQLEQVRKEVSSAPKPFVFNGYFRAGIGTNARGGDQDTFQAPGAYAKYRLGNETETYGEIGLDANWINPERDGAWFKTGTMLAVVAPRNSTFDTPFAFAVRQAYVEAGKIIADKPDLSFWAGQRFYRRRDIHINDFFFHDLSGYGAGFQDLRLGDKMKLAVAYLGGSTEYAMGAPQADSGRLLKNILDVRLYDIPLGEGTLEVWLAPALIVDGNLDEPNRGGMAGGLFYKMPIKGGFNETAIMFGQGGMANFSTSLQRPPPATAALDSKGFVFRLLNHAVLQLDPKLSLAVAGIVQLDNTNGDTDGALGESSRGNLWISAGARPVYMLGKYTGIAAEVSVDITQPEVEDADTFFLGKVTVAPLIRAGGSFWARPELRAFVTAAFWNDAARGGVGGAAFVDDTFGLTAGVQMESWW